MIEWRSFVVDEEPHCMWGADIALQCMCFLDGIDTSYFTYIATSQVPNLAGPDKHRAALTIRATYAHALETFFALLMAAVQAPHCPLGWILRYRPGDLPRIVRKVESGERLLAITEFDGCWHGLAAAVNAYDSDDPVDDSRVKEQFADLWRHLASDFLDPHASTEFNSVKHGLRASAGSSTAQIGSAGPAAETFLQSESEFGAHHFARHPLQNSAINFEVHNVIRNWSPHALVARTELVCLSIGNVVSYLRGFLGAQPDTVVFQCIDESYSISDAWKNASAVRAIVATQGIVVAPEFLRTKQQILLDYERKSDATSPAPAA